MNPTVRAGSPCNPGGCARGSLTTLRDIQTTAGASSPGGPASRRVPSRAMIELPLGPSLRD